MVRKIISLCAIVGCLLVASPTRAMAYSIYDEGNISSTYTTFFKDILNDISLDEDYVYFRSGQYDYAMAVGDMEYNNKRFTGDDVIIYTITTSQSGYQSSRYKYNVETVANFTLDVSDILVYSNLGNYPNLIERGVYYEYAVTVLLIVFGICILIRSIFGFTYRIRK